MQDYEALDIAAVANARADVLENPAAALTGEQTFHGIPFRVPPAAAGCCFVHLGTGAPAQSITIPIGRKLRWLLVAHRLLETQLLKGAPVGRHVADYVFCLEGGEKVRVPIRERFEIASLPLTWGQLPFLAWPDQKDSLQSRYEGQFGNAGQRQTESTQAWPRCYYLWPWRNPHPDRAVTALRIEAQGPRFLIAALTAGFMDEFPFVRSPKEDVRITLTKPEDAAAPFALAVDVDRGVATYPYALGQQDTDAFLADPQAGWGEPQNPGNSPAYVQIAATPSATVTVKKGQEALGAARWGELQDKQVVTPNERVRIELVDKGRNWVHVTVLDDETGKPVPCRVHFRSAAGVPYQPHGHHTHVNSNLGTWHTDVGGDLRLGQITYAYIDGRCQGWLPRGEVLVDVARGYEYVPLRTRIEIQPGQREMTLRLKRFANLRAERYFSGDTHVHFLSTQGSHLEASAEGVGVVNLLQSQWGHLFTNHEEFTGRPNVAPDGETIVFAAQENRQHILGHMTLLGLKESVMPWCSDGPSEAELGGAMETTLSRWADACHAQGGTVVIPHFPNPNCEPATLIATGRVDALEMNIHGEYNHLEYYRYLNCGYRLPLCGGTDKMTSDVPVGLYRCYVHIPPDEEFTYANWCRRMRLGRSFVSGGPLLRFKVEGMTMGDTVRLSGNGGTVTVEAEALSILPIHTLQIVQAGRVVAAVEERNGTHRLTLREKIRVDGHTWLAARCGAADYFGQPLIHHDGWRRGMMAHTSPVYVACGGDWWMFDPAGAQYMLTLINGGLSYIRERAVLDKPGRTTHHHSAPDHQDWLEEPFQQALAAVHRRMHEHEVPH
ncbi:MAG: hypothetical protein A3K19_12085 [Lentisphaerae bacterium RIFOXYB12_FULL_65_16]|nr:MAG: hypothetical protein A3K18_14480 [Lentisphaerae bacterium RIFOXYA12_64_32]OGV86216.1 MAG: hypothetical protein A3K19_12085 [Lentisphaerae bacterium RIFOXYB12_FULL_65_16]